MRFKNYLRTYYRLTKPGIIYGNAITATAGFLLAAKTHLQPELFVTMLGGVALVIASGCVFNNYIDRHIDQKMARTKKRALARGVVSGKAALLYAITLGVVGFLLLALFVNMLVFWIGMVGFIDYVVLYGYSKRKSVYGTLVGSISGATPPVAGYCAVTGRLDMGAFILFLILVCWQMPHFYAIAMYRVDDYAAASIPVLPVKKGMHAAKLNIVAYIAAFLISTLLLTVFGYTGFVYMVGIAIVGAMWLWRGVQGFKAVDDKAWARKMFGFSLVVTLAMSVLIPLGALLP